MRYNNYNLNSDTVKTVMSIAEKIENEKNNAIPNEQEIAKLMYQQLLVGMNLNTGTNRKYNIY